MSEADLYERVAKAEAEIRWIKDKLAERLGIHAGGSGNLPLRCDTPDAYPTIHAEGRSTAASAKPYRPRSGE